VVDRGARFDELTLNSDFDGPEWRWISAPSTAAIGWIPYYGSAEALGESPLRGLYESDLAVRMLFASGNPEPQPEFSGDIRFADRLGLLDFRGIVALRRPRLAVNSRRKPVALRVGTLIQVGTTPIPAGRGRVQIQLAGRNSTSKFGGAGPEVRFTKDGVHLRYEHRFKLGLIADLASRLLTGKFAPFAWIELNYFIPNEEGAGQLVVRSSVVPSVHWYIEQSGSKFGYGPWKNVDRTEMEKISSMDFKKFVDTDSESNGPNGYSKVAYPMCTEQAAVGQ
jgi:hypothetical protein